MCSAVGRLHPLGVGVATVAAFALAAGDAPARSVVDLGPEPVQCVPQGSGCYGGDFGPDVLDNTWVGDVSVSPKIVRVDKTFTVKVDVSAPDGSFAVTAPGKAIGACGGKGSGKCRFRAGGPTNGWGLARVRIGTRVGVGVEQVAVAVIGREPVLRGTVRDQRGAGVAGVNVRVSGPRKRTLVTNAVGGFNTTLPPGRYVVRPSAPKADYSPKKKTVRLNWDRTTKADFKVKRWRVAGRVTSVVCGAASCEEKPLNKIKVNAYGSRLDPDQPPVAVTDAQGNYDFGGLTTGAVLVRPSGKNFIPEARRLDLRADATDVNFQQCTGAGARASTRARAAAEPECQVRFEWEAPERFTKTSQATELGSEEINPKSFPRVFKASTCSSAIAYDWLVDGVQQGGPKKGKCEYTHEFATEGDYTVTLNATLASGARTIYERKIRVQDLLIVSIGDSAASGEGNPPFHFPQCNRTNVAMAGNAARRIEERDPHTSVTFAHFACSGAEITEGLTGPYAGVNPVKDRVLRPQLQSVAAAVGDREIDALHISIGINDIQFGKLVTFCIDKSRCFSRPYRNEGKPKKDDPPLRRVLANNLKRLPPRYSNLSRTLKSWKGHRLPSLARAFITEYPDPTRDERGAFCKTIAANRAPGTGAGKIDRAEARQFYGQMIVPLNGRVHDAASTHGWTYVGGIASAFRRHGYCARNTWVRPIVRQLLVRDLKGTLHPNLVGHTEIGGRIYDLALDQLFTSELDVEGNRIARKPHG